MKRFTCSTLVIIVCVMVLNRAWAQSTSSLSPWQQLQQTIEQVTTTLIRISDDSRPDMDEQIQLLCNIVYERFDLTRTARLCLGNHWEKRTSEEKSTFISLFGRYLESFYLPWADRYDDQQVIFVKEKVEGNWSLIDLQVQHGILRIPISIRLHMAETGNWKVYDITVLGASLVGNLRAQFNHIIHRHSYERVIQIMEEKTDGFIGCASRAEHAAGTEKLPDHRTHMVGKKLCSSSRIRIFPMPS